MKAQILKIAGVKSEKEFYKKFPSEEAFMKAHGKEFKKAQTSNAVEKAQTGLLQGPSNQSNDYYQNNNPYGIASNPGQTSVNNPAVATPQPQGGGVPFNFQGAANIVGGIMGGIQNINAQRKARREAQMWEKVSDVQVKAKASTDALGKPKRMYNRVDDPRNIFSANSYYPAQGVGTNPLAKDGAEIQNTYAPGTLYDDLGYEPLNDPNKVKQFAGGGQEDRAQNFMNNLGNNPYGPLVGSFYGNSGGSQLGGAIGSIGGPVGGALGTMIGGMFDKDPSDMRSAQRAHQRNMMKLADYEKMFGHTASRKDGGPISQRKNINPQIISQFGNVDEQDFYNYAHEGMESLRSGGHLKDSIYTPVSNRGLETMALGGQVKTTWGGEAKTISQNPYMPGTGETINFYGQSHDDSDGRGNTGIGVKYGEGGHDSYTDYAEYGTENADADVEVERGEPSFEMMDPETGEKNLTVLGNLKFDKKVAAQTGDDDIISLADKYNGKKFKNIGLDLSKKENKYTKLIEKSTDALDSLDVKNSFDKLTLAANQANIKAGQMGLQKIANDKMTLAHFQNAINESSEENFLVADDLARGVGKYDKKAEKEAFAKWGDSIKKAQVGVTQPAAPTTAPAYTSKYGIDPWYGNYSKGDPYGKGAASSFTAKEWDDIADRLGFKGKGNEEFERFLLQNPESKKIIDARHMNLYGKPAFMDPEHLGGGWSSLQLLYGGIDPKTGKPVELDEEATFEPVEYKGNKIIPFANQILQYVRPSNASALDPMQTAAESMALADNEEEGVQAQLYYPQLQANSDVSYQDALNEITAQGRESRKRLGYNPAAQSILDAKLIDAKTKVLGEQFRQNQTRDDATYAANINAMNAAQEKNLGILENQYVRQQQAKSNTKAVRQEALKSISDKYLKNKLENKKLQTYENMYNYRYDANGRLINLNGIYQPTIPQIYGNKAGLKMVKTTDANGNVVYKMVDANGKEVKTSATKVAAASASAQPKGKFQKPAMVTDSETPSASSISPISYTPIDEEEDPYGMVSGKGKNGKKLKSTNGSILRSIKNL